ncbi:MAG: transposase, partial [Chthoniobacter sp.]|nr:transposase [Chthoniobacter sp.]
ASCHSRLRDEFLNREVFASALEAKVLGQQHRQRHNHERPHSSLDYQTQHGCALPLNSPSTHKPKTNRNSHSKWIKNRGRPQPRTKTNTGKTTVLKCPAFGQLTREEQRNRHAHSRWLPAHEAFHHLAAQQKRSDSIRLTAITP